jgi:hypothetical protein
MTYEKATIMSYVRKIHEKELLLPAIQRDFVWDESHIYSLLDSIFRGYPFGTLLFWNTKQRVQYREFTLEWKEDERYTYDIKSEGDKATLVLDGQQRMQSLYLALYGSIDGRRLYYDLLSGDEPEDISQAKYIFQFLNAHEAETENREKPGDVFWVQLKEIASLDKHGHMTAKAQQYLGRLELSADSKDGMRLSNNVSTAYYALKSDQVLNFYTVDKEFGEDGMWTTQDEVLEIFVRVNSGGQVLTKSDLMFSLMQLNWEGASDSIADLVGRLNSKGRFNFDKDFILKCALVCVGEGAKYEVSKFRNQSTIEKIRTEFNKIDQALINVVDFMVTTARLMDERIFRRSYNALIPFVFHFYQQSDQDIRGEDQRILLNQALYLSLMTAVYSRLADTYIDQVVSNILIPEHEAEAGRFPMERYRRFVYEKRQKANFDDAILQSHLPLLMNILESGRILPEGQRARMPEYDHIFPKSKLPKHGYSEEQINHFANMRLISAKDNNWKRNQDPKPYFDQFPEVMDYYLVPQGLLDYEQYPEFLARRRELIWDKVRTFLGLSERFEPTFMDVKPSVSKVPEVRISEDLDTKVMDESELIRRMLTRAPISYGQRALYQEMYRAGEDAKTNRELAQALSLTPYQFAGLLGALGNRIQRTEGRETFGNIGIHLLFEISRAGDLWSYRLRPVFRKILEDDRILEAA